MFSVRCDATPPLEETTGKPNLASNPREDRCAFSCSRVRPCDRRSWLAASWSAADCESSSGGRNDAAAEDDAAEEDDAADDDADDADADDAPNADADEEDAADDDEPAAADDDDDDDAWRSVPTALINGRDSSSPNPWPRLSSERGHGVSSPGTRSIKRPSLSWLITRQYSFHRRSPSCLGRRTSQALGGKSSRRCCGCSGCVVRRGRLLARPSACASSGALEGAACARGGRAFEGAAAAGAAATASPMTTTPTAGRGGFTSNCSICSIICVRTSCFSASVLNACERTRRLDSAPALASRRSASGSMSLSPVFTCICRPRRPCGGSCGASPHARTDGLEEHRVHLCATASRTTRRTEVHSTARNENDD